MDDHIDYFNKRFEVQVTRTKQDMPENASFTQGNVDQFCTNVVFQIAYQPCVERDKILDKWRKKSE